MAKKADIVVYGNIYTVDKKQSRAQAVAISGGMFDYVGEKEGVKDYIGGQTQVLHFGQGIILPGLGEGHGHVAPGGTETLFTVHLNPYGTREEHLKAISEFARKHPELDVIQGAMDLLKPLTVFSVEQYKEAVLYFQEEYLAHGETLILDPIINWDSTDNAAEACHQLDLEGKLHMHIFAAYQVFQAQGHNTLAEIEHAAELRERSWGPMFRLANIKVQVDGTIGPPPATAYVKEPYSDPWSQEHQHLGQLRFDLETLTAVYRRSHELGFTVHAHTMADGALAFALDAMEKAQEQTGPQNYRDAVTHLQLVDPADISRMARLGVVAVTDPHWFGMDKGYLDMMAAILGKERAEAQLPMKSFFDAGVVVTSASDYPVENPAYPLLGIQKGVTRTVIGQPDTLHAPAERVTVEQMIEAATLNEAFQLNCEDRLGSITVGKEADMVVLCEDITTCDSQHIAESPVLRTMVGGEWVYIN